MAHARPVTCVCLKPRFESHLPAGRSWPELHAHRQLHRPGELPWPRARPSSLCPRCIRFPGVPAVCSPNRGHSRGVHVRRLRGGRHGTSAWRPKCTAGYALRRRCLLRRATKIQSQAGKTARPCRRCGCLVAHLPATQNRPRPTSALPVPLLA